jgi:hypothetical protein
MYEVHSTNAFSGIQYLNKQDMLPLDSFSFPIERRQPHHLVEK